MPVDRMRKREKEAKMKKNRHGQTETDRDPVRSHCPMARGRRRRQACSGYFFPPLPTFCRCCLMASCPAHSSMARLVILKSQLSPFLPTPDPPVSSSSRDQIAALSLPPLFSLLTRFFFRPLCSSHRLKSARRSQCSDGIVLSGSGRRRT